MPQLSFETFEISYDLRELYTKSFGEDISCIKLLIKQLVARNGVVRRLKAQKANGKMLVVDYFYTKLQIYGDSRNGSTKLTQ